MVKSGVSFARDELAKAENRHAEALAGARPRILAWWQETYLANPALALRFTEEARSSLPLPHERTPEPDEVFAALDFRRLRLRQDTQAPEWAGVA